MSFMSWLFGNNGAEKAVESEKDAARSLIARLKDDTIEESNGDTQMFIKSELDAAAKAEAKRVEHKKETDEKVEAHRKRADTEMRKVAEKTCGMSDIFLRDKDGNLKLGKVLTEEEQEEAQRRAVERMKDAGWRESRA